MGDVDIRVFGRFVLNVF